LGEGEIFLEKRSNPKQASPINPIRPLKKQPQQQTIIHKKYIHARTFTPVNVGTTGNSCSHENMRRLDLVQFSSDRFPVFDADLRIVDLNAFFWVGGGLDESETERFVR
jgi:hypothetical protein